jgi:antitoxin component YwqK of YwqJK toxin-antitoxin module
MKQGIYILTLAFLFSCSETEKIEVVETWPDGSHKSIKVYIEDKDKSAYLIKDYYANGTLSFEGKVNNNQFLDYKKSYFPNGNQEEFVELSDSADLTYCCPDGFYKVFYENGQLKETHHKMNGLFNGLVTK